MQSISYEQSGAFIEQFTLPPTGSGPLDGLHFAVKDLIDVAGHRTGGGNPTWLATHPPATVSAICVEQLLAAGAQCEGKTITDELAFSLLGENHFYGTPLNPAAPDRVPGGSSSGSASAVACGLVDFALGTDTGGSVRIPASNCGIWGLRPSHGLISVAGVMPLAPTLDTVGVFARNIDILQRAANVLLPSEEPPSTPSTPGTIHLVREAFDLADEDIRQALSGAIDCLREMHGSRVRETSIGELCRDHRAADLATWVNIYRLLQGTEMMSCHGAWIDDAQPAFGPAPSAGFVFVSKLDRTRLSEVIHLREHYDRRLNTALAAGDLLCLPTSPTVAPRKGSTAYDRTCDYYQRTLSLTAIAGVGRLPQISMPLGNVNGTPIGISLAAAHGADQRLVEMAEVVSSRCGLP